ncbi:MAG TPA: hypothetical protein VG387_08100 [Rhizomicrobium sp.]|jgi:hypothetical protein|nr:hypothetical protein [Rhizomicrobium sp.]
MRALYPLAAIGLLGFALSGCVAYDVAATTVDVATTVVSTTAHVAKGAIETVTPGGDDDEDTDSDHHKKHKSSDDDDDN